VTARYAYDPFGKRRYTDGAYDLTGALIADFTTGTSSGTSRGFTGHEQLDDVGIVHMNGRLFDPMLGRFMQADPLVQDADYLPSYNRYQYCNGNPLSCTDPSGYCFLGCFWQPHRMWHDMTWEVRLNIRMYNSPLGNEVMSIAVAIAIDYALGPNGYGLNAFEAAGISGFASGMVSSHGNLDGGLRGAAFAVANVEIGNFFAADGSTTEHWSDAARWLGRAATHAVLGCVEAATGGSKCGAGAMAAGVTSAFEGEYSNDIYWATLEAAIVGGFASRLAGGKFTNGAETAAFSYLFNAAAHGDLSTSSGDGSGGALDVLGKLWNLPNTAIGLVYGSIGYAVGWGMYEAGWQALPPDVIIGNNAIEFTHNPFASGGAITIGNVEVYGGLQPDDPDPMNSSHSVGQHEMQHTYQGQVLGPLYLPAAAASLLWGTIVNGNSHGPASFMETGPQSSPPSPW